MINMPVFENYIAGTKLKKSCSFKKCKKSTQWVFFEVRVGFIEACDPHKESVVQEIIMKMIKFDFAQGNNLPDKNNLTN